MNRRKPRLLLCVGPYPSPYKSYYDAQFADFLRAGYDLQIMAVPALDATTNEKVLAHRLHERTHNSLLEGRTHRLALKGLARPITCARFVYRVRPRSLRRAAIDMLRMLALPDERPDVVLVHELAVGITFQWIRDWFGVPVGLYYHGGEVPSVKPLQREAVARAFRSFDVVFTNTEFSRQQAIDRGCPPERVCTLPVGFDLTEFQPPTARRYRPDGTLRLVSAGRLSEEKGLEYALEALRIVVESGRSQIVYSVIGEGYLRPKLEKYVKEHGLEQHVRFLGALTSLEVTAAMATADALVLSSIGLGNWVETQACAVQEAMLMQAVVVTTQLGGVPESIPEAMTRFSVPERNASALAEAIIAVYDLPESELECLGRVGRDFVMRGYDIRKLNEQMIAVLCR